MASRPAHDGMVFCDPFCCGHAEQVGGSSTDRERLLGAQSRLFGRFMAQHQLGNLAAGHRWLLRCHHWRQSSVISAHKPGSPSRHATTLPGKSRALAARAREISTIESKIHPGMAPGMAKAVERDIDRTANKPIVRATHRRKGVQGSRFAFNAVGAALH